MKILITLSLALFVNMTSYAKAPAKGDTAPAIKTTDINGKSFDLSKATQSGPTILVFYRGGWCPYCNLQLKQLQNDLVPQLKKYKAQIVVISSDKADEGMKTKSKYKLDMTVISDAKAQIVKAYDIVNQVPKKLVKKYKKEYKIDIEKASGQTHNIIPIPAVFIVDKKQKVRFSYVNEDYKVRAQIKDILNTLKSM